MAGAIIGIDPHKGSHTAIAIDVRERQLGQVRVRASARQAEVLLQWAARWPTRAWAIEGARGLGYLLAQQLIAADQRVLDVPPKLAARVRLLNSGQINKNDEERRPLGRHYRTARPRPTGAQRRGPDDGDAGLGAPLPRSGPAAHPGHLPARCRARDDRQHGGAAGTVDLHRRDFGDARRSRQALPQPSDGSRVRS